MNEISSDTMDLVEAAEFTDELTDEALDRPQAGACNGASFYSCQATACF